MKSIYLIVMVGALLLAGSLSSVCQEPPQRPAPPPMRSLPPQRAVPGAPVSPPQMNPPDIPGSPAPAKDEGNFTVRVEWKDSQGASHHLEVLTTEGNFDLDTFVGKVKIDEMEVPTTIHLKGSLTVLGPEKGKIQLFLGRTVPYVTSTYSGGGSGKSSSYQQMQVGIGSTFMVTFGKPMVIKSDDNETVTLLVKRVDG